MNVAGEPESGGMDEPEPPCVPGVDTEIACNNNPILFTSQISFPWSGGNIYLFVDGFGSQYGAYQVQVNVTYPEGGQCGPVLHDYALCTAGTECRANEAVGHPTCQQP